MKLKLHQTHNNIADFDSIYETFENIANASSNEGKALHLFPELFLTGYPLQDLCLNRSFRIEYENLLDKINSWSKKQSRAIDALFLLGGLKYRVDSDGEILYIENVIYSLVPGDELEVIYTKILLPNYDIFDEKKYFKTGEKTKSIRFAGKHIGLLLCEDMWPSSTHPINPVDDLKKLHGDSLDLVVNLSGSPFDIFKQEKRLKRGKEIASFLGCHFAYVNRVGGEDEVLFDGGSFICDNETILVEAKRFQQETVVIDSSELTVIPTAQNLVESIPSTWEGLFAPALVESNHSLPRIRELTDRDCELLLKAIGFGLQEYATKSGFNKFLIALSGGMDSALVLALISLHLREDQEIEAVYMPSRYSRKISQELSIELCKNLKVPMFEFPIENLHDVVSNEFEENFQENLEGLADENIQSRLRGAIIYARSNSKNSMVVNTSNKSELAVGYSTLYGDSVGALSLLGDLYKSEVFALAKYINKKHGEIIPEGIITRPPSAELRDDQEDSQSLPSYDRLDAILEGILSYRLTLEDLVEKGFEQDEVKKVINLYRKTEYKRFQFCPIIKVKAKSFGFGYRVPLSKNSNFYL